uniref:Uncharacterized protein n=1 Tax=Phlebotomus papatasi TaxID=29031 RepID=A0A1B0DPJ9_PHLPP
MSKRVQLVQKKLVSKRENVKGGSKQKFDAVDDMIMKIIEVDPLSVGKVEDVADVESVAEYDVPETSMPTETPSRKRKARESDEHEYDIEEKILNVELMRVKIYKARLKCLALERNLGVPLSEITKPLLEDPNNADDTKLFLLK